MENDIEKVFEIHNDIGIYTNIYESGRQNKDGNKMYYATCKVCGTVIEKKLANIKRNNKICRHKTDEDKYNCLNCGKEINSKNKYCSHKCQLEYQQKQWEEKWLNGEVSGNCNGSWQEVKDRVRNYLFKKYDNKCSRCGWGEINPYTGKIPLEVEHIDGNAENTTPDNVILLCPNCHSLTKTYRGANRGNGRPKTWIPKNKS